MRLVVRLWHCIAPTIGAPDCPNDVWSVLSSGPRSDAAPVTDEVAGAAARSTRSPKLTGHPLPERRGFAARALVSVDPRPRRLAAFLCRAPRHGLHVVVAVRLVDYLDAQQRLDRVLERHEAARPAVLVNH